MKPITYKEFEEKINDLGAEVCHREDVVEVNFENYPVGEISKQEKFEIDTTFGYIKEFENVEMSKILKLMLRLSATEISDRKARYKYKYKLPNCHETHYTLSWLNVHRFSKEVAISSDSETMIWQTEFTEEEIESLPEEVRMLIGTLEAHKVEH